MDGCFEAKLDYIYFIRHSLRVFLVREWQVRFGAPFAQWRHFGSFMTNGILDTADRVINSRYTKAKDPVYYYRIVGADPSQRQARLGSTSMGSRRVPSHTLRSRPGRRPTRRRDFRTERIDHSAGAPKISIGTVLNNNQRSASHTTTPGDFKTATKPMPDYNNISSVGVWLVRLN
jgi:hypothetical protein